ncbi:MAG: hydrogenase formation protein HypD [Candidatus Omnitrophota bacterium]
MKYVDEFRDGKLIYAIARKIRGTVDRNRTYRFMDVCGTHTMNIFRFGLREILPSNIELISGPGCPVCVTPNSFLDSAIALAKMKGAVVTTFGDMLRVPGSYSTLEKERAKGCSVRVVYSSTDSLDIARRNPGKEIIFLGVGFETTIPTVAVSILDAKRYGVKNYSVLCGHKTMPEALRELVSDPSVAIDGFILPGHVSAIIGPSPYGFLHRKYKKRCVITGFEPLDILQAILMLVSQRTPGLDIQYTRAIGRDGNRVARKMIAEVFKKTDSAWRGIGTVRNSGLAIRERFAGWDAGKKFDIKIRPVRENKACLCGDVLKGTKTPHECRLFGRVCTPETPVGSCMVSSEGTCAAYFKYRV